MDLNSFLLSILLLLATAGCTQSVRYVYPRSATTPVDATQNDGKRALTASEFVTSASMRLSPATCERGDACSAFSDAVDPADAGRIKLVVHRPTGINPGLINVKDENGDGFLEELHAALDEVRDQSGLKIIKIAYGSYRVPADPGCADRLGMICLNDLTDVEIDGAGAELKLDDEMKSGIVVENSQRLLVKNLTVNRQFQAAYRAKVKAVGSGLGFELQEPGLPQIAIEEIQGILGFDTSLNTWYLRDGREARRLNFGPGGLAAPTAVTGATNVFQTPAMAVYPNAFPIGSDLLILRNRVATNSKGIMMARGHGIQVQGRQASDITFENVSVKNVPQNGFNVVAAGRGLHFKNCRIIGTTSETVPIATRGGGINVAGSEGDILIEGRGTPWECKLPGMADECSRFNRIGDSAINLYGQALAVTGAQYDAATGEAVVDFAQTSEFPKNELQTALGLSNLKIADQFMFVTDKEEMLGFAEITSVVYDATALATKIRVRAINGTVAADLASALASETKAPLAFNLNLSSSRSLIRNVGVYSSPGTAIVLQSPNAKVVGTLIEEAVGPGIEARFTTARFYRGPGAINLVLANNVIRFTNLNDHQTQMRGAFTLVTDGFTASDSVWPTFVSNVLLMENHVSDTSGLAVQATGVSNLVLKRNYFYRLSPLPVATLSAPSFLQPEGLLYFSRASGVKLENNLCPNGYRCTLQNGVRLDSETTNGYQE